MSRPELLTADEVADRLRVQPSTIRRWTQEKKIPAVRLTPKVVRYEFDAVVDALRSQEASA